jgi:hypothetical protein
MSLGFCGSGYKKTKDFPMKLIFVGLGLAEKIRNLSMFQNLDEHYVCW